ETDFILNKIHNLCVTKDIEAHIVGGFVRDLLLDVSSKDIDIVVVGKGGIEFARDCATACGVTQQRIKFFKNFGTANFTARGVELEFVGARKESYNRSSRKPIVEDGTLFDDQQRRDFTINTLSIDLRTGELIDPFGGIKDLHDGIIKTPIDANITFSDDPLRQLRAIRFATRFNFTIENETKNAINKNIHRLAIVSQERILVELTKMLLSDNPRYGIELMNETGLLNIILPELVALKGVEEIDGFRHKDNFLHTMVVLEQTAKKSNDIVLRWTALLHDIGKVKTKKLVNKGWTFHSHEIVGKYMLKKIAYRLKLPNKLVEDIGKLIENHGRPKELVKNIVTDSAIRRLVVDMGEQLNDLLLFCSCDITTRFKDRKNVQQHALIELFKRVKTIEEIDNLRNFELPITGDDIMKEFDLKPSKLVGDIKDIVKE
ncbi:MAG: CCA tRNA nucleotidyltransferase, partial [Candidatus Heimdallarchaeota archaeon]